MWESENKKIEEIDIEMIYLDLMLWIIILNING